ncbi:FHA domain-containing protein [bacterium]|nr:FHA domain-containing protein [bacterium]
MAIPEGAPTCSRCGAYAPGSPLILTVALTPESGPGVARLDSRYPAIGPVPTPPNAPRTPTPDRFLTPPLSPPDPASVPTSPGSVAMIVITPPPAAPAPVVKLRVIRGMRVNVEYPVYPGRNVVGRFAEKPVDIDLTGIEPDGQVWSSRRHAALTLDKAMLVVEDLNSLNGTWVNGTRLRAGAALALKAGDVIQIGVAQLRVDIENG